MPIYHLIFALIFATDSDPGDKIMNHLYGEALTRWPQMREQARPRSPGESSSPCWRGLIVPRPFELRRTPMRTQSALSICSWPFGFSAFRGRAAIHPIPVPFTDQRELRKGRIARRSAVDL